MARPPRRGPRSPPAAGRGGRMSADDRKDQSSDATRRDRKESGPDRQAGSAAGESTTQRKDSGARDDPARDRGAASQSGGRERSDATPSKGAGRAGSSGARDRADAPRAQ